MNVYLNLIGWAYPLRGFMREDEYLQVLHFNSLRVKGNYAKKFKFIEKKKMLQ
jgi:hypothetical protein